MVVKVLATKTVKNIMKKIKVKSQQLIYINIILTEIACPSLNQASKSANTNQNKRFILLIRNSYQNKKLNPNQNPKS